jgi:hypothetical protein
MTIESAAASAARENLLTRRKDAAPPKDGTIIGLLEATIAKIFGITSAALRATLMAETLIGAQIALGIETKIEAVIEAQREIAIGIAGAKILANTPIAFGKTPNSLKISQITLTKAHESLKSERGESLGRESLGSETNIESASFATLGFLASAGRGLKVAFGIVAILALREAPNLLGLAQKSATMVQL